MSENLNDLEMAKKRDYKIMITDAAINKVPRVQYKEIPETEYDNLRELAEGRSPGGSARCGSLLVHQPLQLSL